MNGSAWFGPAVGGVGYGFVGHRSGVGDLLQTDVAAYAARVDRNVTTLDADIRRSVLDPNSSAQIGQDFQGRWTDFVDGSPEALPDDSVVEWRAEPAPPIGWRPFRLEVGIGVVATGPFHDPAKTMRNIGLFEIAYADFRREFVAAGGKTSSDEPAHPGSFETEAEHKKDEVPWESYAKVGLVILTIGVIGYTLSQVVALKPHSLERNGATR